jgi:translation elongation factor EF-4
MVAGMKATTDAWVGDTLYLEKSPVEPLPGFKPAKPMVRSNKISIDLLNIPNLDIKLYVFTPFL